MITPHNIDLIARVIQYINNLSQRVSVLKYFNAYDTPYEAYINYMNVLSDFSMTLN